MRSKNVDSWISEHDPAIRGICEALRSIILEADGSLRETIKWSHPAYLRNGDVMYLAATDAHVRLGFFQGAGLTDPDGRIEGMGKRLRHVKIRALEDIDRAQIEAWVREAVALDGG